MIDSISTIEDNALKNCIGRVRSQNICVPCEQKDKLNMLDLSRLVLTTYAYLIRLQSIFKVLDSLIYHP
jgi:hypothetical protein